MTELGCLNNIVNDVVVDIVVILLTYLWLVCYVISHVEVQDLSVYGEGSSD